MKDDTSSGKSVPESRRLLDAYERRRGLAHRYTVFNPSHLLLLQARERSVLSLLRETGIADLSELKILDVGCGTGQWLLDLLRWGASADRICGVDMNPQRIAVSRARLPRSIRFGVADGARLPHADGSFDLVIMATVISSVLDDVLRQRIAADAMRVLAPGGHLLWYDLNWNNRRNPDVRGISRKELQQLFPDADSRWRRVTLAPPLGRLVAPISTPLHHLLETLPFLRSHTLAIVRKREGA